METNIKLNLEEVNQLMDILVENKREKTIDWRLFFKVDTAYRRITRKIERAALAGVI